MIVDKDERIIQLVAAPAEMTATFEWWNDEFDEEVTDDYPVACFALVEDTRGQRIEPVVVSDKWQKWGVALASDLKGYMCCSVDDKEATWTHVKTQNGGICPVDESTAIIIEPEPAIGIKPAWIKAIKDGVLVELGYYDDILLAQKQLEHLRQKIVEKDEEYVMKTSKEMVAILHRIELAEIFGHRTLVFENAGFHSIEEMKKATDEELAKVKLAGIGKAKRADYIRQQIAEYEKS